MSSSVTTGRPVAGALHEVRGRVAEACRRAGRDPAEVRLIAVVKRVPRALVGEAAAAGVRDFGENDARDLGSGRAAAPEAAWHYLGRVQRSGVRRILDGADWVHALEPGPAGERLARLAEERGRPVAVLLEVDFTGRRVGVSPGEAESFAQEALGRPGLEVRGLMTIAPLGEDPRPWFTRLRELRDRIRETASSVGELSMGMSADYEVAVEEGATMVRVGAAIFGARP